MATPSRPHAASRTDHDQIAPGIELSVVLPCLNEAETLERCVRKAQQALADRGIAGEVIVADNGSTDGSPDIAARLGARVVPVAERGYGHALMAGIAAARGRFIIMGDADDSYDFLEIPRFLDKLREGHELVQGCRLPSGGGRVMPGAMPGLHRWIGNPLFTCLSRLWFGAPIHDSNCGLRGFSRDLFDRLDQRCTGMEFANEMVIKASLIGARIGEVPITLHPDGRTAHPPHLKTFRDGWRTLRFYMMYSPRWLFLYPGLALVASGFVAFAATLAGLRSFGTGSEEHALLGASLAILLGYQSALFAVFTKTFAVEEGLMPRNASYDRLFRYFNLERGLAAGGLALVVGIALLLDAAYPWLTAQPATRDGAAAMRWVIPGATLTALGFQTVLSSFFMSILGLRRR